MILFCRFSEAENVLSQNKILKVKNLDDICREYGEISCFVMKLLSKICQFTERSEIANECSKASLKQNPFLWQSFVDLCNRGERPEPKEIFQIINNDVLMQSEQQFMTYQQQQQHPLYISDKMFGIVDYAGHYTNISSNHITPVNNIRMCGIEDPTITPPTPGNPKICLNTTNNVQHDIETPYRKQFKYLASTFSPVTPSFGILPLINSPLESTLKQTTLFLTPSPPPTNQQQLIDLNNEVNSKTIANNNNKKLRGHISSLMNRKDTPLQQTKPVVFNQSSNITPRTHNQQTQPQTPQQQQQQLQTQNVRRSSRLFSNNYSVKENNKSPNVNKFVQPRSPPRKANKRIIKLNKATLNELNEKNCLISDKEKIETITSTQFTDNKFFGSNISNINCVQQQHHQQQLHHHQLMQMKRQSAEGLMQLLQHLGQAYMHLQQYETKEAIQILENNIPSHQFLSSWVQSLIAVAHHEQREYDEAVKIFTGIHKREPFRLQYMEIYSTDLWHLQKDALLSALAQDLMQQSKGSAITWCVAGNCFSALKEHDTAIKFFNRAIQMDPDFPYSYTLLGHELVVTEELDKALSCYRKAILKDPRHYNAWFGIGTIYSKQERFQLAEIHYRHALKINQKNSVILVHIGVMQFYLQKPEQAIQTLNQAITLEPQNPLCKFHRASMNFSIGKLEHALQELEELKQIVPKESVVYYLIGKIHKQLGNIDLALMHFSWATDLDPKGANNQIKDKFDSIIRSQQQSEQTDQIPLGDQDEDGETSGINNNNDSGSSRLDDTLQESEISHNHNNQEARSSSINQANEDSDSY